MSHERSINHSNADLLLKKVENIYAILDYFLGLFDQYKVLNNFYLKYK